MRLLAVRVKVWNCSKLLRKTDDLTGGIHINENRKMYYFSILYRAFLKLQMSNLITQIRYIQWVTWF